MLNQSAQSGTKYSWGWPALMGVLLIVLGAVVIGTPILATIEVAWLMGVIFLVSGIAQLIHAFRFTKSRGWASRFLLAALSIVAGLLTLKNPIAGAVGITVVLSFYLLLGGIARGIIASEAKGMRGRGWLIFSAMASIALGIYLFFNLAANSLVIPGTLLGVDLIFYGASLTFLAANFRRGASYNAPPELRRVG